MRELIFSSSHFLLTVPIITNYLHTVITKIFNFLCFIDSFLFCLNTQATTRRRMQEGAFPYIMQALSVAAIMAYIESTGYPDHWIFILSYRISFNFPVSAIT